ncbi:MAG: DUF58 domain-containing protein [Acidimicrobiales bacterium]
MRLRPTRFGVVLLVVLVLTYQTRSGAADATVASLAWASGVALLVLGVVWPWLAIRLVRVDVVDAPVDSSAGATEPLTVSTRSWGLLAGLDVLVDESSAVQPAPLGGTGVVTVELPRRRLVRRLAVTVSSDSPLGVARARRTLDCPLPRPLAVAPTVIPWSHASEVVPDGSAHRTVAVTGVGDVVRSVRPYRTGDPAHLVHWPSSARAGELVVRELEPPLRPGVILVVRAGEASPSLEHGISSAAGLGLEVLAAGGVVIVCSATDEGPVVDEVRSPRDLGRALAAAVAGDPAAIPAGADERWPIVTVTG